MNCSPELCRLFAFAPGETPTYENLIDRIHPDDRATAVETVTAMVGASSPFFIEHRLLLPDGEERWIRARGRLEVDPQGQPERLSAMAEDIDEQRKAEDALFRHAFHDPLTGLPNRHLFLDRLDQALHRLSRYPSAVGVIYFDIDRFKRINDSLGHRVGDQLLLALTDRLTSLARHEDTVGRIGADEFVVLCQEHSGEAEVVAVADRISRVMAAPLAWDDGEVVLTVSTGIALATSAWAGPDSLLRDAAAAMHRAKGKGRAHSEVFAETMRTNAVDVFDTERSLRGSIDKGELRLHYQPIVTLADGTVLGHEALVR